MEVPEAADARDQHRAATAQVGGRHGLGDQGGGAQAAQHRRHPAVPGQLARVAERRRDLQEPGDAPLEFPRAPVSR